MSLLGGANPIIMMKKGVVGYMLISIMEKGPDPLLYSSPLFNKTQITRETSIGLSVLILTAAGMLESFEERSILIPVPHHSGLVILAYSFLIPHKDSDDPRLITGAPVAFGVIIPTILMRALRDLNLGLEIVLERVKLKDDLSELQNEEFLEQLTVNVLRKIIS